MQIIIGILTTIVISGIHGYILDDLVRSLLTNYEPAVRPGCDNTDTTNIDVDLAIRQIVDLDEPRQILNTIIWIRLAWVDCRLQWFNTQYRDIDSIVLPQHKIWIPDVTLYDNAANKLSGIDEYHLKIDQNGTVSYNFPSVIKSLCGVDVTHFPFDYQACRLEFGSWAHSGSDINIRNSSIMADLGSYIENVEWYIKSVPVIRHETFYDTEMYPTVRLYILLERRPLFHVFNLLFPCLLITSVAILGFLLPPVSGEKVNLEITVLLSLAVFQLIVLELMPPTGDTIPFIGIYFTISMLLVSMSCLATVTVLNVHFKGNGDTTIPRWLKVCFYIPLTKIMCMTEVRNDFKRSSTASLKYRKRGQIRKPTGVPVLQSYKEPTDNHTQQNTAQYLNYSTVSSNGIGHTDTIADTSLNGIRTHDNGNGNPTVPSSSSSAYFIKPHSALMDEIDNTISDIDDHLVEGKHDGIATSEWRIFSMMLDRLFMAIYFVFLLTIALALSARYIQMRDLPKLFTDLNVPDELMIDDM